MKIACPKCSREYVFKQTATKKNPMFECYACHSLWNGYKESEPVKIYKKHTGKKLFICSLIFVLSCAGMFYLSAPKPKSLPFLLENVRWFETKGHVVHVMGDLINPTMTSLPTMPLTITVEAPCSKQTLCKAFQWNHQVSNPILMAREKISFKTSYKIPPNLQIARIVVCGP